jgi:hypothetical protein
MSQKICLLVLSGAGACAASVTAAAAGGAGTFFMILIHLVACKGDNRQNNKPNDYCCHYNSTSAAEIFAVCVLG